MKYNLVYAVLEHVPSANKRSQQHDASVLPKYIKKNFADQTESLTKRDSSLLDKKELIRFNKNHYSVLKEANHVFWRFYLISKIVKMYLGKY